MVVVSYNYKVVIAIITPKSGLPEGWAPPKGGRPRRAGLPKGGGPNLEKVKKSSKKVIEKSVFKKLNEKSDRKR